MSIDEKWERLFTRISAFRASLVDHVGRIAAQSETVRGAGLTDVADEIDRSVRELASGLETLTREADGAQDETIPMSFDEVAG